MDGHGAGSLRRDFGDWSTISDWSNPQPRSLGMVDTRANPRPKRADMKSWLYQMTTKNWSEENYRAEVWEGTEIPFSIGRVTGDRATPRPTVGDRIFCWYTKWANKAPGLCGWGVVTALTARREEALVWRPVFPSDLLKMSPLIDEELNQQIDTIRPNPRGTLYLINPKSPNVLPAEF